MPRFVGRLVQVGLIALFAGCTDSTGPKTLLEARETWDSANLSSYKYVAQRICFCGPPEGQVVVTVVNDVVVGVVEWNSGSPVSPGGWLTVDQMFAKVESASAAGRLIDVEFHDAGYPTRVEICCQANDSGVTRIVSNLHPLSANAL